jgi:flavin-dependent dehydrogenase
MTVTRHFPVVIIGGGPSGLLSSLLLSQGGIQHCIIDKHTNPTTHPQAHFISTRSMEIIQSHFPSIHKNIVQGTNPVHLWKYFTYSYSVLGRQFARVDQFSSLQVPSKYISYYY